ncbi:MAG TPA: insulinase family protein [Telluria sp.]|nr:insulinase family protein [Telluria sp.]
MSKQLARTLVTALLFISCSALAAIDLAAPLPVSPRVTLGHLPNGLTYYIQKNGKPENKLELRLVVKAGSILEDEDQRGMAHFVEHMAFNGTTHFRKHELVSYLESIGVQFGADLNAYTSFDETVYILPIPTANPAHVDKGFQVLADWAGGLTFAAKDIDQERAVVLEELRLGKGANDRMQKVLLPKLFNGSRYAQRLPIGQEAIITKGTHAALKRFYHDWYRPNLMAVLVVGDIEPQEAERLIKRHFSALTNPAKPRERFQATIAPRSATEALVITDKEANGNGLLVRYPVQPAIEETTLGGYRAMLVRGLFATMINQRLQELSQQAKPPFLGAGSDISRLTAHYESYTMSAGLGKEGAMPAISALIEENARASQFGFSESELDRARKNLMRRAERMFNERDKTDSSTLVSEYIRHFLHGEAMPGAENEFNYMREMLPSITLGELNRFARDTIPTDAPKLIAYTGAANSETPTPTSEQLLAAFAAAEKVTVTARDDKAVAASLMDTPPVPGTIVGETRDARLGLTTLTLSNGVKVILKPTDFRNDQVLMSAVRDGGQSLYGDSDRFNARYASGVASAMGVGTYTPVELRKILAGKSAGVAASMNLYSDSVGGASGSTEIESMLQLLYLRFTTNRRDPEQFQTFVARQLEAARNAMSQPEAVFQDTQIGTLYQDHPRVQRVARPEDFSSLDLDRSLAIYKERFSSAKGLTFMFVGSFDVEAIKPLIATYVASLPTPDLPLAFRDLGVETAKGVIKKEVRRGTEAKASVSISFAGDTTYSEDEQMRVAALLEAINIKITETLREKLSLIYGGGLHGGINRVPKGQYLINLTLPTGPANVDKVIAAAFAEIEKVKANGPDKADLNKVKQNWILDHRKSMRENGYWMSRMQASLMAGTDPASLLDYEKKVEAITTNDLKLAARRYFDMHNYVQVVLYPEK